MGKLECEGKHTAASLVFDVGLLQVYPGLFSGSRNTLWTKNRSQPLSLWNSIWLATLNHWYLSGQSEVLSKVSNVPLVTGSIPNGAPILIIQQPSIGLILDGLKTLDVRPMQCRKKAGLRVYFANSKRGSMIIGSAVFQRCIGPLKTEEWISKAKEHCLASKDLPFGNSTYVWEVLKCPY